MILIRSTSPDARIGANWLRAAAPHIKTVTPPAVVRALTAACRAVDRDVEQFGGVSITTVEQVRAALDLARTL